MCLAIRSMVYFCQLATAGIMYVLTGYYKVATKLLRYSLTT